MAINLDVFAQEFDPECIQVCKVYDWTTNVLGFNESITFTFETGALAGLTIQEVNCNVTLLECREDGARRDIECVVGDEIVLLQAVSLFKTIQVVLVVTGTNGTGQTVTIESLPATITTTEEVILCAPEGTTVCCTESEQEGVINCRVGSFTVNGDTITAALAFSVCQNIIVIFEVILEVAARFCQPRPKIICDEECPVPTIPPQCPSVFPITDV